MWQVKKSALKTRAFQEACVFSVIEELTEHLAKWSYSAAFYELSFVPAVRLHKFCKSTKVDRFRREIKQLIHQVWVLPKQKLALFCCRFYEILVIKLLPCAEMQRSFWYGGWRFWFFCYFLHRLKPTMSLQIRNVCQSHFYLMIHRQHLFLRFRHFSYLFVSKIIFSHFYNAYFFLLIPASVEIIMKVVLVVML